MTATAMDASGCKRKPQQSAEAVYGDNAMEPGEDLEWEGDARMTKSDVGRTIFKQLGGGRFLAMTGAKGLLAGDCMLQFQLPACGKNRRINGGRIELRPDDLYRVIFYHRDIRRLSAEPIAEADGIDVEAMRSFFESTTGLYLTLR